MDNKQIVAEVYSEGFSNGRLDVLDRYVQEGYVNHHRPPGSTPGLAGLKATMTALRQTFPDLHYVLDDLVGEGDRVAVRATMAGTDRGGWHGKEPTGRHFEVTSLAVVRFEGGKVAERWGLHDVDLMAAQLAGDT